MYYLSFLDLLLFVLFFVLKWKFVASNSAFITQKRISFSWLWNNSSIFHLQKGFRAKRIGFLITTVYDTSIISKWSKAISQMWNVNVTHLRIPFARFIYSFDTLVFLIAVAVGVVWVVVINPLLQFYLLRTAKSISNLLQFRVQKIIKVFARSNFNVLL